MVTVAVIGAGQIGSRHLQALARSARVDRVEVVGRSVDSLRIAEERYRAVATGRQAARFGNALSQLSQRIDVAIVATNSDTRFAVVHELVRTKRVRCLILEKVAFQSGDEFARTLAELDARGIAAWVNCFRRAVPLYSRLRSELKGPLIITVEGGEWGLGCNSVHYLDLFAFLTRCAPIVVSSQLDAEVLPSKRAGFVEFTGRISSRCGPHQLELVARRGSAAAPVLRIQRQTVDESGLPLTSELTHKLVEQILDEGRSDLPTLRESYAVHAPLLDLFSAHLERATGVRYARCPVT